MGYEIDGLGLVSRLSVNGNGEISFRASEVRAERTGIHARIAIFHDAARLAYDTFNVGRQEERHRLARTAHSLLGAKTQAFLQKEIFAHELDGFCYGLWDAWQDRHIEENIEVMDGEETAPPEYMVYPIMLAGQPNLLFGEPSSSKSLIAIAITMTCQLPWPDNPFGWRAPEQMQRGLYLDWERNQSIFRYNMGRFVTGHNLHVMNMPYRRMEGPLWRNVASLKRTIQRTRATYAIIDSVSLACGGEMKGTETPAQFFDAERELGITTLSLGHTSKDVSNPEHKTFFGSYMFQAQAGNVWEAVKVQGETDEHMYVALFHRKQPPFSGLSKPFCYRADFSHNPAAVVFQRVSIDDVPEFSNKLSGSARVLQALRQGPLGKRALIDLGLTSGNTRTIVSRLKKDGLVVEMGGELQLAERKP